MNAKSARGLFRATGKQSKPISIQINSDLLGPREEPEYLAREKDDFYPTPPEPTQAFIRTEIERLQQFSGIWEPAAGDGAMIREMESFGLAAWGSDLIDRGCGACIRSFYEFKSAPFPAIVTNPPFAECNRDPGWVRHALAVLDVEYMALLLPVNWLGASSRAQLWAQYPPARIYLMRWELILPDKAPLLCSMHGLFGIGNGMAKQPCECWIARISDSKRCLRPTSEPTLRTSRWRTRYCLSQKWPRSTCRMVALLVHG